MTSETIDRCELCGLVDHHCVDAECPSCRTRFGHQAPDAVADDVAAIEPAEFDPLPLGDEADVTHVLALMGAERAMETA